MAERPLKWTGGGGFNSAAKDKIPAPNCYVPGQYLASVDVRYRVVNQVYVASTHGEQL